MVVTSEGLGGAKRNKKGGREWERQGLKQQTANDNDKTIQRFEDRLNKHMSRVLICVAVVCIAVHISTLHVEIQHHEISM